MLIAVDSRLITKMWFSFKYEMYKYINDYIKTDTHEAKFIQQNQLALFPMFGTKSFRKADIKNN